MKKTVLFWSIIFYAAFTAMGQDTVDYFNIPQGYMVDNTWWNLKTHNGFTMFGGPGSGGEYAKRFDIDDSVTIYGIAAGIIDRMPTMFNPEYYIYDTSYTNSIEYLRLYYSQADTLVCLAQTPVHLRTTPIAYYMRSNYPSTSNTRKFLPMYERYFDTAVTVYDSFYAGMTFDIERDFTDSDGNFWQFACPPLRLSFLNTSRATYHYIIRYHHHNADGLTYDVWGHGNEILGYLMLFPLLLPPDTTAIGSDTVAIGDTLIVTDTVIIGGDTIVTTDTVLSIMPPDLLQRLTGVTPNPARGTARVVASTGLTMVEAYNMAGRKVHTQRVPQGTLAVTLDVSRWPAGTYLLRIHTPLGATVKKLTVTR